ncbi:MAG: sulfatase-like hydrolase/transferase [Planctomycetes bacterium]|jgi:arylsulfatase A-like enzyme|nr:sulfatase-like hydrolase/transferase [Planctomycetota bacterium]
MRTNRRAFLKMVGAGVWLAGADPVGVRAVSVRRPNIILCMADDQGWGDMAYNGHPVVKTPHFDRFAAEALRFDRFYAAAPVCSPTRGSVMTGRHPNRFGCFKWGHPIRPQEITVAEALKKAGYVTGHFGKWHLGSVCKGSPVNPGAKGFDEWFSAPNFFDNDPIMSREGVAVPTPGESSMITVEAALAFIRKHAQDPQPFLAVVWFGNPHAPHEALEPDRSLYPDQNQKLQSFYGEITAMDRAFGRLREELRALGLRANTLLWYCSDNGGLPGVGVSGGRGNKGQIYEGGLRVPALLEWPARIPRPHTTNVPCNTVDIYPTLLEVAGAKVGRQPPLDGVSLVPLLDGRMKMRPRPMGFWDHPTPGIATPSKQWMASLYQAQQAGKEMDDPAQLFLDAGQITQQYPQDSFPGHAAWLDWPWKLHRIEKKKVTLELYNLADDPQESTDLAGRSPERVQALRAQLEAWLLSVVRSLNGKDYVNSGSVIYDL